MAIWIAVFAFVFQAGWSLLVERPIQRDEGIVRAWSLLSEDATGNSGKGQAMSYLAALDIQLVGLDLSCQQADSSSACTPQRVYELELNYPGTANLQYVDFEGAEIINPVISSVQFTDAILRNLIIDSGTIDFSIVNSDIDGMHLFYPTAPEFHLLGSSGAVDFRFANLGTMSIWQSQLDRSIFILEAPNTADIQMTSLRNTRWAASSYENVSFAGSDLSGARFECLNVNCEQELILATQQAWVSLGQEILIGEIDDTGMFDWRPLSNFSNFCTSPPIVNNAAWSTITDQPNQTPFTLDEILDSPRIQAADGHCKLYLFSEGPAELDWGSFLEDGFFGREEPLGDLIPIHPLLR